MFKHQVNCTVLVMLICSSHKISAQTALNFKEANKLIMEGSIAASSSAWQESIEKQSNDAIRPTDLMESIGFWKKALEKDPANANLNYKVGVCYFLSYDEQLKALPYFKQAIKDLGKTYDFTKENEKKAPYNTYYFLAETYLENNQPDSALKYFGIYKDSYGTAPLTVEPGVLMSVNAKEGIKNARNVKVSGFGNVVNTPYAETNPVMRLDNKLLFFSSRRPGAKETTTGTEKVYNADIYFTLKNQNGQWENVIPFPFNTQYDEAPLYLSPNGDVLYFRRTVENKKLIYKSTLLSNAWSKPKPVVELNSPFNETGMSMSADGKYLFFCSDRNKLSGKYDIYKCTKQKGDKWGQLEVLDPSINSAFNEVSPYISPDGKTLFFSSNTYTKKGMGSYDIYYSELKDDNTWTRPNNMGYPINKTRADINYYVSGDDKRYYASLTENNSYDIFTVEGGGFDFESIAVGTDIVTITNEMGVTQVMETEKTVEKEVEVTQAVETIVEKEKEVEVIKTLEVEKEKEVFIPSGDVENDKSKKEVKVSDVNVENLSAADRTELIDKLKNYLAAELKANESVKFKTVYFDFNKSNLSLLSVNELKLLVEFLGEHPETKIEIAGHGDNRGSWQTNLDLSNKRAKEVYEFLVANKVSTDRMFFYGKGSAVPVVTNDNEENRGKNRRVEVFILK